MSVSKHCLWIDVLSCPVSYRRLLIHQLWLYQCFLGYFDDWHHYFYYPFPISYDAARHIIDIDLLTRYACFSYFGSTITSLIYSSYTFPLFALKASIMSQALELYFKIHIALVHIINAILRGCPKIDRSTSAKPDWPGFSVATVQQHGNCCLLMIAQIGEQVDFLRFMLEKNQQNLIFWWVGTLRT